MGIVAPEGVEIELKFYLTTKHLNTVMTLSGLPHVKVIDTDVIIKNTAELTHVSGWRMMTRDEIKAYKEEEKAEEDFDEGVRISENL